MSEDTGKILGWDDEIEESGGNFTLLPAGDYNFTVEKFERARHPGSANLPACPMALLTLKIDGGDKGEATVINRLFLHSKTEGFLSNFFESIGHKKEGERVKMNWNAVPRAQGRCKIEENTYTNKDGEERTNNQIKTFLPYEEYLKVNQQSGNTGQFNQQQAPPVQQQQQAQPFPTNNQHQAPQQNQQQGGFVPGQF